MPATTQKTLSPAELAKLEHAFATDPSSDAYHPLAEAYLGMGRFMEAMVVCKKGVKAHPNTATPRVLLARVYAEQGKEKKALEELQGALQVAPSDKWALRLSGVIQLKGGDAESGKSALLKAFDADPADSETLAAMQEWKVAPPKPAAPPAPAPVAAPAPAAAAPAGPPVLHPPVLAPAAHSASSNGVPQSAPRAAAPAPQKQASAPAPRASNVSAPPRPARPELTHSFDEEVEEEKVRQRSSNSRGKQMLVFVVLLAGVILSLPTLYFFGQWKAKRTREVNKYLTEAGELLKRDSYDSYQKMCQVGSQALELDPNNGLAHSYLAYAWAIRWGEHGGGDTAQRNAQEHLKEAQTAEDAYLSHLHAAQALINTYMGKGAEAQGALENTIKKFEGEHRQSALLNLTLGLIRMNLGDLTKARDNLEKAQTISPDDARVYAALGTLSRRSGQDQKAWTYFTTALRYETTHPESLIGMALLMLEQDDPKFLPRAAEAIKKLRDVQPPPSPRQLATAHMARSFLIARLVAEGANLPPEELKKASQLAGVPTDPQAAKAEVKKAEDEALVSDPSNPELLLIKGRRLLLVENDVDGAVKEIREAVRMDPKRAVFYVELARALMKKQGGEKEAQESLLRAIQEMGESPKLVSMLGDAYRSGGQPEKALEQYQRAISAPDAKNPDARLAMGALYRERKDYPKAQDALEKAAQEFVSQSSKVAEAYTELGRVFDETGDRTKAEEIFKRALNADSNYAPVYYFFAKFLSSDWRQAGQARQAAKEYLRLDPRGAYAQDAQRIAE